MDQKGLMFVPHIVAIQQGTTVEFLNSDSVAHNVFWPSISGNKKLSHNLGTWPQGQRQSYKFGHRRYRPLFCNVHPDMAGYLIVSPTPFFATTDKTGAYKIESLPDGDYNRDRLERRRQEQVQSCESRRGHLGRFHAQQINPAGGPVLAGCPQYLRSIG